MPRNPEADRIHQASPSSGSAEWHAPQERKGRKTLIVLESCWGPSQLTRRQLKPILGQALYVIAYSTQHLPPVIMKMSTLISVYYHQIIHINNYEIIMRFL